MINWSLIWRHTGELISWLIGTTNITPKHSLMEHTSMLMKGSLSYLEENNQNESKNAIGNLVVLDKNSKPYQHVTVR